MSTDTGKTMKRKYPVGIQSFESIRKDGYMYVDKTPVIYKMITEGKPYFLNRPRRFGKSLLISTLQAVFEGRRELFEAFTTEQGVCQPQLYIATTDWKWGKHPVLRFDFSAGDLSSIEQLDTLIDFILGTYEQQYGITPGVKDPNIRMVTLLRRLHKLTGQRVVVLVDEYDNFILHALGDAEKVKQARQRFQNVFGPLKAEDDHLQFVFITGISKFSQMGIFSKLNNLINISMQPEFETVCGISEEELTTVLRPDIELLGVANGKGYDEQLAELKRMYDGYHFCEKQTDMYNPFSLINALRSKEIASYWFDHGTSGALVDMLSRMPPLEMARLEGIRLPDTAFDLPFESFDNPLPVLYQSGYLTIKDHLRIDGTDMFTLDFPNREVRRGFADCLFKHVAGRQMGVVQTSDLQMAYLDFYATADLARFVEALKAFYAAIPYQWAQDNRNEHFYHALLYTLLVSFGANVRAEEPTAKGRSDIVLLMPKAVYIIEIKYDKPAEEALAQIDERGYADKYALCGRPLTKVGISFSSEERNITDWKTA